MIEASIRRVKVNHKNHRIYKLSIALLGRPDACLLIQSQNTISYIELSTNVMKANREGKAEMGKMELKDLGMTLIQIYEY